MNSGHENALRARRMTVAAFAIVAMSTALVYLPGLSGAFVFDDFPNIVDNTQLHVSTNAWSSWLQAMLSSPASEFRRPLSSLSFALNYYLTGLDPAPMKIVNLVVHVVNGALLLALLRQILAFDAAQSADTTRAAQVLGNAAPLTRRKAYLAVLVSAAWTLHPINLTAVLYVVQRMESLAQIFVLCGLMFYLAARARQLDGKVAGWRLWAAVPACTVLGIAAKESAALLPVYAFLLERVLLRRQDANARGKRELLVFFCVFLALPAVLGLSRILPGALSAGSWASRDFTLSERLLSEARVLMAYVNWTLVPVPGDFSLYHDDIVVSRGLFEPWTTFASMVGIVAMWSMAWTTRRSRPLVTLGIAWFFAAHLLTATLIPLELVFEHRNYFASAGLLLAAMDIVLPNLRETHFPVARFALVAAFLSLCALTTLMRARDWSHPVRLAMAEASAHPASARANYELGRALLVLTGYRADSSTLSSALNALERAADTPRSNIQADVALLTLAARTGQPVDPEWWDRIERKLRDHPLSVGDTGALTYLAQCSKRPDCVMDRDGMTRVFIAAVSHRYPGPAALYAYAIYAFNGLDDPSLALQLATDAVAASPSSTQYRLNLVSFMIELNHLADAAHELDTVRSQNRFGEFNVQIAELEHEIASRRNLQTPDTAPQPTNHLP